MQTAQASETNKNKQIKKTSTPDYVIGWGKGETEAKQPKAIVKGRLTCSLHLVNKVFGERRLARRAHVPSSGATQLRSTPADHAR